MQGWLGLVALVAIAWLCSEQKSRLPWRLLGVSLLLQFLLAVVMTRVEWIQQALVGLNQLILVLEDSTQSASRFLFGYLAGGDSPYPVTDANARFILALQLVPLILVFSALSAIGWHWRLLPWAVNAIGSLLRRSLGVGGALGMGAGASVLVGMVEAPMTIRPLLREMDRGELFALMTCGMATVAGTVILLYASLLGPVLPDALGHIIAASVISLPAALLLSQVMVPAEARTTLPTGLQAQCYQSTMDAITQGTSDGLRLAVNVIGLLLVLLALVALLNAVLGLLPEVAGTALTLERILGWLFAPIAWLLGIPWHEATAAGALLGSKLVLNEMIAYLQLVEMSDQFSAHTTLILTYALCGFANLGSLGILTAGLLSLCPERRDDILQLAPRTLVSGTLATLMTGTVIGLVGQAQAG